MIGIVAGSDRVDSPEARDRRPAGSADGRPPIVLVTDPERVGLAARLAALASGWVQQLGPPAPILVAGAAPLSGLDRSEAGVMSIPWSRSRPLPLLLDDHRLTGVPLVLWDLADLRVLDDLAPLRPTLVIESWLPPGAAHRHRAREGRWRRGRSSARWLRRVAARTERRLYCGLWPLIESPEDRSLLGPEVVKLDPWSVAVGERPAPPEGLRRTLLVVGPERMFGGATESAWNQAAERVLDGAPDLERVLFVSGRGELSRGEIPECGVVRRGIVPRLADFFARARAALIPPTPHMVLLARALNVPALIVAGEPEQERRARYLAARFGLARVDPSKGPEEWFARAAALARSGETGGLRGEKEPLADRAGQERALRAMIACLARQAIRH